jgi:arabinofuranosyltransferase
MSMLGLKDRETHPWLRWWPVLSWLGLLYVLLSMAWVCDDAYISFRTVDNFMQGEGLVFNPGERVQAFTHPLWMLLHVPFYALTGNIYYVTIFLSLLISLGTAAVVARVVDSRLAWGLVPLLIILSKALTEYSSSGLENPLTHLLLALFAWVLLARRAHPRQLWHLGLLFALLFVNRMDAILLLFPALVWRFWEARSWRTLGQLALGMTPILVWEAFSVVYYGFPFPNTAYAKLGTGIGNEELFRAGIYYYWDSIDRDFITIPLTLVGAAAGLLHRRCWPLALGILLYLAYILRIGGDFMSGRFLTAPAFLAMLVLLFSVRDKEEGQRRVAQAIYVVLMVNLLVWGIRGNDPKQLPHLIGRHGVADERRYYEPGTGLSHALEGRTMPDFRWVDDGRRIAASPERVHVMYNLGFAGFYAGPKHYLLDRFALADPLLARMPALVTSDRRPGHYERVLPEGYVHSVRKDTNALVDPALRALYADLRLITQGPIWSSERWEAMWRQWTAPKPDLSWYATPVQYRHVVGSDPDASWTLYPNKGLRILRRQKGWDYLQFWLKEECDCELVKHYRTGRVHPYSITSHEGDSTLHQLVLTPSIDSISFYPVGDCNGIWIGKFQPCDRDPER